MIIVLDTETTGREPPEVIELAFNILEPQYDWRFESSSLMRFRPTFGSCLGALATHHILDQELVDCNPSATAKLPEGTEYMIGHNVDYDWKALGQPAVKRICTLALCRHLWPDLDSHRLGSMVYHLWAPSDAKEILTVPGNGGFGLHSAQFDTDICTSIFHKLLEEMTSRAGGGEHFPWTPHSVWEYSERARIPTVISFGKHRGTKIKDLPLDYRTWMLRQADMDPYVLQAVRETMRRG